MSSYGEFYPSSNNDNCVLDSVSDVAYATLSGWNTAVNPIWRGVKFASPAATITNTVNAGGDSGVLSAGVATLFVNTGMPFSDPLFALSYEVNQTYLRFDTS